MACGKGKGVTKDHKVMHISENYKTAKTAMMAVLCGRNPMNNFLNSSPSHISTPIHECQPRNTLYAATVKWCHWRCIYIDWSQDFNGMSKSGKWNCVPTSHTGECFDLPEVEKTISVKWHFISTHSIS
jgi:hypothetical protein